MTKHFCDRCKIEVSGVQLINSLTMTGKVYCSIHQPRGGGNISTWKLDWKRYFRNMR